VLDDGRTAGARNGRLPVAREECHVSSSHSWTHDHCCAARDGRRRLTGGSARARRTAKPAVPARPAAAAPAGMARRRSIA
jgi:hypothetical protein